MNDQDFLVFEQTSDNGKGMKVHQSKMKLQKKDSVTKVAI